MFKPGQTLRASDLNAIVSAILRRVVGGDGVKVRKFGDQIIIETDRVTTGGTVLRRMRVQSDQGDYLICRTLDASDNIGTADVYVMKPWTLRRTPFEGKTVNGVSYTYSANGTREAGEEQTEKITQDYFAGAEIYVMNTDATQVLGGRYVRLVDANVDARAWGVPTE